MQEVCGSRQVKRRDFLKGLIGAAVVASIPLPLARIIPAPPVTITATIAEYADWISVSDLAMDATLDPVVMQTARQLAYRVALTVDRTIMEQLNT